MGAFEFDSNNNLSARNCGCGSNAGRGEVCIIAQKILDQCRIQKCLTPDILGPARAATNPVPCCNEMFCDGDIIVPPCNATDVIMKHLRLKKIEIIRKTPSPLQSGCWDIELKYIFEYTLEFRRADGCFIGCIDATNSYTLKLTLFGGSETDITVVNDMFNGNNNSSSEPYCIAEGKALGLEAELKYANHNCSSSCCCCCDCCCDCGPGSGHHCDMPMDAPIAVSVTIGLFTIVQLFRTVNMLVESAGRCLPEPCVSPLSPSGDPCANFDAMSFPWDLFSPNEVPKSCCAIGPNYSSPNCELDDNSCGNHSCNCNNSCGCNNRGGCR
ncbi:hypothetical protein [Anaerotignum sp.]|uniref:hypothetical protein n=1 Tax=Anaerotignum sp. TaxID=2039241 RepID=UPI0027154B21|nr:hypothetical protein [Anaerotignum sp.]